MIEGKENFTKQTFAFLKKAFLARGEDSVRGPAEMEEGDWKYTYKQEGDLVFFHRVIGGTIIF